MHSKIREVSVLTSGLPATDGDGVKLTRLIGSPELNFLDPFLLLDSFESLRAQDYIGGFPEHPHRGFETVTYLLAGRMRHKDSMGHKGVIEPGGVQWMTAGKGIIHSEMPEQEDGLLQGFQLWVNLPASEKMQEPAYQNFSANELALESLESGTEVRVIAGRTNNGTTGPVINRYVKPIFMDVSLPKGQVFKQDLGFSDNAFIFVISGEISIGEKMNNIGSGQLSVLDEGDQIILTAASTSRILIAAAQPLNEPIVRGGPFVMNTKAEILQAFDDFKSNLL